MRTGAASRVREETPVSAEYKNFKGKTLNLFEEEVPKIQSLEWNPVLMVQKMGSFRNLCKWTIAYGEGVNIKGILK